jgi:hypothetical protein
VRQVAKAGAVLMADPVEVECLEVLVGREMKRKRCSAALRDLLEALKRRDAGGPMRDIVKSFNVSRSTIRACRT